MNTIENDDAQLNKILGMVDAPQPKASEPDLSAAEKELIRVTMTKAYYTAKSQLMSTEEARAFALERVHELFAARPAVSALATAALEPTGTRSDVSQPAKSGSASSTRSYREEPRESLGGGAIMHTTLVPQGEDSKTNLETHGESERQGVDVHGLARSERDLAAVKAAGFSPKDTVWTRGLRVIQAGVDAAKESRLDFESKPLVETACHDLESRIDDEKRSDLACSAANVRMTDSGLLTFAYLERGSPLLETIEMTTEAFASMCSRLEYGGAQYLANKCDEGLRAHNVNAQHYALQERESQEHLAWSATGRKGKEPKPKELVFRTRRNEATKRREIFATVTPGYAAFDVDKVAAAIREATPAGARGSVTYDGRKSRFEVLFQSTVQPRHFVAGEFFRAGVLVSTDDTGGGSIRGSSVVWQNLCLNLAIIDRMAEDLFCIRHVGSVLELARKFKAEFRKALAKIGHFTTAWDYACVDDVLATAAAISDAKIPASQEEAVRGIFRGLLSGGARARIHLPNKTKVEAHVDALLEMWSLDDSSATKACRTSRAAIVNAFTRYAHTIVVEDDPFADDEIQRQASALLWGSAGTPGDGGKAPRPLEYVEMVKSEDAAAQA